MPLDYFHEAARHQGFSQRLPNEILQGLRTQILQGPEATIRPLRPWCGLKKGEGLGRHENGLYCVTQQLR